MGNLILLVACFVAGIVIRVANRAPLDAHKTLNAVIVNLALPATALLYLHELRWAPSVLVAILMPWATFAVASLVFVVIGRSASWSKETLGALILLCGLGNTSFVGLPMIEALYGREALPVATALDQAGTYLVLSTIGLVIAAYCGSGSTSTKAVVLRVSTYPPFIAMVLAVSLIPVGYPQAVTVTLHRLSDTLAPLALLSVGMQMSLLGIDKVRIPLIAGLTFKLVVCPALVIAAYLAAGIDIGVSEHVVIIESAMGPAIGAGIVAAQHNLKPQLVTLLLCIGIPLSIVSATLLGLAVGGAGV